VTHNFAKAEVGLQFHRHLTGAERTRLLNSGLKWDPKIPKTQRSLALDVWFSPIAMPMCLAT